MCCCDVDHSVVCCCDVMLQGYGAVVELRPNAEILETVDGHVNNDNMFMLHPFDCPNIISGHAT